MMGTTDSRHFDLSLEFVTQTGGEFALTPETRTIANLCSLTVLHRVDEEQEKIATWFDLSERQANWVTSAKAGDDADGYSEALLGIDQEGWFPLRIRASDYETDVIDGTISRETNSDQSHSGDPTELETLSGDGSDRGDALVRPANEDE